MHTISHPSPSPHRHTHTGPSFTETNENRGGGGIIPDLYPRLSCSSLFTHRVPSRASIAYRLSFILQKSPVSRVITCLWRHRPRCRPRRRTGRSSFGGWQSGWMSRWRGRIPITFCPGSGKTSINWGHTSPHTLWLSVYMVKCLYGYVFICVCVYMATWLYRHMVIRLYVYMFMCMCNRTAHNLPHGWTFHWRERRHTIE